MTWSYHPKLTTRGRDMWRRMKGRRERGNK